VSRPYRAQLFNRYRLLSAYGPVGAGIVKYLAFLYLSLIENFKPMRHLTVIAFILIAVCHFEVVSQPCLPEGIIFTSQSQIDSFSILYPNCTEIEGSLVIGGSFYVTHSIESLDSLVSVTAIGGGLEIIGTNNLKNLSGLDNLTSIGGDLTFIFNFDLISLSALQNLVSIGGSLTLSDNDDLNSLSGLENISSESIDNLTIWSNNGLSNCEAVSLCNYLSNPNGYVRIAFNDSACFGPPDMADMCGIEMPCLPYGDYFFYYQHQIDSFDTDYPNCNNLNGNVWIGQWVTDLYGLSTVDSINGSLHILQSYYINDLLGLENLKHIEDSLELRNNYHLFDLMGLIGLNTVGGGVSISNNDSLTSLYGFDSITSIGGSLSIDKNINLLALDGIGNIAYGSISNLTIVDNRLLSKCNVQSICDYLVAPNGTVTINDNSVGCNSQQEVEEACTVGVPEMPENVGISVYPNPFTPSTTIEYKLKEISNIQFTIYNVIGEVVFTAEDRMMPKGSHKVTWSPSHLPEGMYFAVLRSEGGVSVIKLIKQ